MGIFFLGLISPGPDFALVVKNSLQSRALGNITAAGVALGILVHVTYSIIGLGVIVSRSLLLFNLLKILGAFYLVYLGCCSLFNSHPKEGVVSDDVSVPVLTWNRALRMGFLNSALNPKTTVVFVALFTQIVGPQTSDVLKAFYGLQMAAVALLWFMLLASLFGRLAGSALVKRGQQLIGRIAGVVMIGFGIRLAMTRSR